MLPKTHRLRQEKDIKALFARGKSVFDIVLGLKFRKNNLPVSRFAVAVGVKISKKAVVRNRLRRRLRAILEKHFVDFRPGFDVIILVKEGATKRTFVELEKTLLSLLDKSGVRKSA
jgi:ribonuclease P protein component